MGEYFNGVKIGTCEHLMYVTRKEVEREAQKHEKNTDRGNPLYLENYLTLEHNYIYRLPFPDEDKGHWLAINDRDPFREIRITVDSDIVKLHHADFAQVEIRSRAFNLPFCPYSEKAQEIGIKSVNQWGIDIYVIGQRFNTENPKGYTIFSCVMCDSWFACDEKEIEYIKTILLNQNHEWLANYIKPKRVE